jgi:hypothetical protein
VNECVKKFVKDSVIESSLTKKIKVFNELEAFDRPYHEVENQGYIYKTVFCNDKAEAQAFWGFD